MTDAVCAALITGALTLLGTVLSVSASTKKQNTNLETRAAVLETKLEGLTEEVRLHNNFARRMPAVEERMKSLERRVAELEKNKFT